MIQWLSHAWFEIVQTLGIAGSLLYAAYGFDLDRRMRKTEVLFSITEAHRSIWEKMIDRPELARVLDPHADLRAKPPSSAEKRFVNLVLLHVAAVWKAVCNGAMSETEEMRDDIRQFIRLPIPAAVLAKFMNFQDEDFRDFLGGLKK